MVGSAARCIRPQVPLILPILLSVPDLYIPSAHSYFADEKREAQRSKWQKLDKNPCLFPAFPLVYFKCVLRNLDFLFQLRIAEGLFCPLPVLRKMCKCSLYRVLCQESERWKGGSFHLPSAGPDVSSCWCACRQGQTCSRVTSVPHRELMERNVLHSAMNF